jgi:hypothetical protein
VQESGSIAYQYARDVEEASARAKQVARERRRLAAANREDGPPHDGTRTECQQHERYATDEHVQADFKDADTSRGSSRLSFGGVRPVPNPKLPHIGKSQKF